MKPGDIPPAWLAGSFFHVDPGRGDLANRLDSIGIDWNRCSENLYLEKGIKDPAAHFVQSWQNSPGHRKNMLDFWMFEAGVGAALQNDGVLVIVQAYVYQGP